MAARVPPFMADPIISKKKPQFAIHRKLNQYLRHYNRYQTLPVQYNDLLHYTAASPLYDKAGEDTLWESVMFSPTDMRDLFPALTRIYALLKTEGNMSVMEHLRVDRVDFCTFGNTNPFRIRIINDYNDNYDYYYVKTADASRVYGLELEDLLSPNRINYYVDERTMIEEHIAGLPGDVFIDQYIDLPNTNEIRLAKEFIKFNERCFVRLLGDMRAYNFVIDITPDFDDVQYRIKAIDFDQQSYEGKRTMYQPHFFKENRAFVQLGIRHLNDKTLKQYQQEERTLISMRMKGSRYQLGDLIDAMAAEPTSTPDKVYQLRQELSGHYKTEAFTHCETMAQVLRTSLELVRNTR